MGGDWNGAESCIQLLPALLNPRSAAGKQAHVPRALPKGQCLVPRLHYSGAREEGQYPMCGPLGATSSSSLPWEKKPCLSLVTFP